MLLFDEPLWLYRRETQLMLVPQLSLEARAHSLGSAGNRLLSFDAGSYWRWPAVLASLVQSVAIYSFVMGLLLYYQEIANLFGFTHVHMSFLLASIFMTHFLTRYLWTNFSFPYLSVRTLAFCFAALNAASTYMYLKHPHKGFFIVMVVLKGFFYGLITGPTQTLVAHYTQVDFIDSWWPSIFNSLSLLWGSGIVYAIKSAHGLQGVFYAVCLMEVASAGVSFLLLSRTTISRQDINKTRLNELLLEANEDFVARRSNGNTINLPGIFGLRSCFIRRTPGGLHLIEALRTEDGGVNSEKEILIRERRSECVIARWAREKMIIVFKEIDNEMWFCTKPDITLTVMGQSLYHIALILVIRFPALVMESVLKKENCTDPNKECDLKKEFYMILALAGVSFLVFTGLRLNRFELRMDPRRFKVETVLWISAFVTFGFLWDYEMFETVDGRMCLGLVIGVFVVPGLLFAFSQFNDLKAGAAVAEGMDAKLFLGTAFFSFVLVVQGAVHDHTGDFLYVYHVVATIVAIGASPYFVQFVFQRMLRLLNCLFPSLSWSDICRCFAAEKDADSYEYEAI